MVKQLAKALGRNIPEDELERIAPVLEDLLAGIETALDRDLSTTDPMFAFRPGGEVRLV